MRRVVVSGGASGIGKAVAERFASSGAAVAILDVNASTADSFAARLRRHGSTCVAVETDVTKRDSVFTAIETAATQLGGVDVLVNAAGIFREVPFEQLTDPEWDAVVDCALRGTFLLSQAVTPRMREAGGGSITNVSSVAAINGSRGAAHYGAAKGGVVSLTKSLALQLAPAGIRVNAVCPGPTRTPIFGGSLDKATANYARVPLGRMAEPDEIASVIEFISGPAASFMTGAHVVVDGGFSLG